MLLVSARATANRQWYDLTGHARGAFFWPKAQQYKHAAPANDNDLVCNCNLYDVSAFHGDPATLGGILNSTWAVLSKFQYGRPVGVEGNLKTEIVDVKMMLVTDPGKAKTDPLKRVGSAFEKLKQRKALMFLSERRLRTMAYTSSGKVGELDRLSDLTELDMPDRRELDDAVLEMIGIASPQRRQELIDELYAYLREFFEATRQKEEKAIINKNSARRRERIRPTDIAAQIHKDISQNEPDLLRQYDSHFLDKSQLFDTYDLPAEGEAKPYSDMLVPQAVKFTKGAKTQIAMISTVTGSQAELITLLSNTGTRGLVRVPHDDAVCSRTFEDYRSFIEHRDERVKELIHERTSDEETQEKILAALLSLINH